MSSTWPAEEAPGEVRGFQLEPNSVEFTYEAHTPGILVLTDSYDAGWKAEVNGEPAEVLQVNGVFRGVRIESPGEYIVRFLYEPPYWKLSLILAGIGLLGLTALSLASFFPRRVAK